MAYKFAIRKTINAGNFENVQLTLESDGDDYAQLVNDVESKMVALERGARKKIAGGDTSPDLSTHQEPEKKVTASKVGATQLSHPNISKTIANSDEEKPEAAATEVTAVEVRAAVAARLKIPENKDKVLAVFNKYGIKKLPELESKKYRDFLYSINQIKV